MTYLTPQDVARLFKKSPRWVYNHASELGGARIGKSLIFTERGIEDDIQRGQEMARMRMERQKAIHISIPNQKRGKSMGNNQEKRAVTDGETIIRDRLLDSLHQVS